MAEGGEKKPGKLGESHPPGRGREGGDHPSTSSTGICRKEKEKGEGGFFGCTTQFRPKGGKGERERFIRPRRWGGRLSTDLEILKLKRGEKRKKGYRKELDIREDEYSPPSGGGAGVVLEGGGKGGGRGGKTGSLAWSPPALRLARGERTFLVQRGERETTEPTRDKGGEGKERAKTRSQKGGGGGTCLPLKGVKVPAGG